MGVGRALPYHRRRGGSRTTTIGRGGRTRKGGGSAARGRVRTGNPPPLCDIPSGCCFFTGPWTVTRSSLRMLRRVAAFCRPLRPVLLLVSFPRSRSPVVGVLGLCWMWRDVPFARQRRPIIGVLRLCPTPPPKGAFSHSARTARAQRAHSANYYGDYPGNNPENHPPAESCTINSKLKNSNI